MLPRISIWICRWWSKRWSVCFLKRNESAKYFDTVIIKYCNGLHPFVCVKALECVEFMAYKGFSMTNIFLMANLIKWINISFDKIARAIFIMTFRVIHLSTLTSPDIAICLKGHLKLLFSVTPLSMQCSMQHIMQRQVVL